MFFGCSWRFFWTCHGVSLTGARIKRETFCNTIFYNFHFYLVTITFRKLCNLNCANVTCDYELHNCFRNTNHIGLCGVGSNYLIKTCRRPSFLSAVRRLLKCSPRGLEMLLNLTVVRMTHTARWSVPLRRWPFVAGVRSDNTNWVIIGHTSYSGCCTAAMIIFFDLNALYFTQSASIPRKVLAIGTHLWAREQSNFPIIF